jgi:hypothetical protein
LITSKISAVAVCCSKASRVSDQPSVFDGDDRLIGKGADQFDLPLGERRDPETGETDCPDHLTFAH